MTIVVDRRDDDRVVQLPASVLVSLARLAFGAIEKWDDLAEHLDDLNAIRDALAAPDLACVEHDLRVALASTMRARDRVTEQLAAALADREHRSPCREPIG